jgi:hypothetical protein
LTATVLETDPLLKTNVHLPPSSETLVISTTAETNPVPLSTLKSMKLNFATSTVGEADEEADSLGVGDASDGEGDCEVEGFWSVPQFGYSKAQPLSDTRANEPIVRAAIETARVFFIITPLLHQ